MLTMEGHRLDRNRLLSRNIFRRARHGSGSFSHDANILQQHQRKSDCLNSAIEANLEKLSKMSFLNSPPGPIRIVSKYFDGFTVDIKSVNRPVMASNRAAKEHPASHPVQRKRISKSEVTAEKCKCGLCEICCQRSFTAFLKMLVEDQSLPELSAKSWAIWRKVDDRFVYIYGRRPYKQREIASLTKMMVALLVLEKLKKWKADAAKITCTVPENCAGLAGTSANLAAGQLVSVRDLLYGLMLPSGNDAAVLLSELFGHFLQVEQKKKIRSFDFYNQQALDKMLQSQSSSKLFITALNERTKALGVSETVFYNAHGNDGYQSQRNISTASELSRICFSVLENSELARIVNTKVYGSWTNTNKLLWQGFHGIKTGTNQSAGACLAACYHNILVVVLNCKSPDDRWIEVKKLVRWACGRS